MREIIFSLPSFGQGSLSLWLRNFFIFRKNWLVSLSWVICEPIFYLLAIGYGLGAFVQNVGELSYVEFFFPALLANSAMMIAFLESSHGVFSKLFQENTYRMISVTPISTDEIVLGEILWAMFKGMLGVLGVYFFAAVWGLVTQWSLLLSLPILMIICWSFAAFGVYISTLAQSLNLITYITSGLIIPMSLFSGTYFPLSEMPEWVQVFAQFFPLTHGVTLIRETLNPNWNPILLLHLIPLGLFGFLFTNLAIRQMRRRLID